jgi:hypothetical protein
LFFLFFCFSFLYKTNGWPTLSSRPAI